MSGLVKQDGKDVVAYAGNANVSATVTISCSLIAYEFANKMGSDIDHFHVEPADETLPDWMLAEEFLVYFPAPAPGAPAIPVQVCADGAGSYTQTADYPFGVSAQAPGGMPLVLNLTANLGDDAFSDPKPVNFAVQFHGAYTLTPSVKLPLAVTTTPVAFNLSVRSDSNGPAMVMFAGVRASTGAVSGFADVNLQPNQTLVLPIVFTPPTTCWTNATIAANATIMAMAGAPGNATPIVWMFTHSCGGSGKDGSKEKKSSAPGSLLALTALGLVALRRRRDE
jgi:hypothetical protein